MFSMKMSLSGLLDMHVIRNIDNNINNGKERANYIYMFTYILSLQRNAR